MIIELLLNSVYADLFAVFADTLKFNGTVNKSKEGIVRTSADIVAGVVVDYIHNKDLENALVKFTDTKVEQRYISEL